MTLTLTDFLLARLDEDEAVARAATAGAWEAFEGQGGGWVWGVTDNGGGDGGLPSSGPDCRHIARHDPARVLAEVAAKRQIVEDFEILHADYRVTHDPTTEARRFQARVAMAHVASVYADHPDFRDEWRG